MVVEDAYNLLLNLMRTGWCCRKSPFCEKGGHRMELARESSLLHEKFQHLLTKKYPDRPVQNTAF